MSLSILCENSDPECPICMSTIHPIGITTTICKHKFHINCLNAWTQEQSNRNENKSCPICRQDIDDSLPNIIYWEGTNNIKIFRNKDMELCYFPNGKLHIDIILKMEIL